MLTTSQVALLNNKIANQLRDVGTSLMPPSRNNTETFAWDYLVASKIAAFGNQYKEKARKKAIQAGVMFDHEKSPLAPGSQETVYSGDVIQINVSVKQPSVSFDAKAFYQAMVSAAILTEKQMEAFNTIYQDSLKTTRPAHTFTCELLSA